jgi:hypothetical protein
MHVFLYKIVISIEQGQVRGWGDREILYAKVWLPFTAYKFSTIVQNDTLFNCLAKNMNLAAKLVYHGSPSGQIR